MTAVFTLTSAAPTPLARWSNICQGKAPTSASAKKDLPATGFSALKLAQVRQCFEQCSHDTWKCSNIFYYSYLWLLRHVRKDNLNSDNKKPFFHRFNFATSQRELHHGNRLKTNDRAFPGAPGRQCHRPLQRQLWQDPRIFRFWQARRHSRWVDLSSGKFFFFRFNIHSSMKEFRRVGTILEAPKFIPDRLHY